MIFKELKKYLGLFILAVAVIIVYKTFDNFGIILDFFAKILHLLTPFFIGAAIAFILRIPCRQLERMLRKTKIGIIRKSRRGISIFLTYFIVIATIALIIIAIIPQLGESVTQFVEQLPYMMTALSDWISSLDIYGLDLTRVQEFFSKNILSVEKLAGMLDLENIDKYAQSVKSAGSVIVNIFLGIIISIYMLLERRNIRHAFSVFARAYIPHKHMRNIVHYCNMISSFTNKYIGCQLLDACIVFFLCLIVLSIMRAPYAGVIALMVGSFNLIPYFGAIIAVFISALITLVTSGFMNAVILVVVLIVLQQLDANIIQPRLVANSLSIKPLYVILGVILGGGLFGIIGMFLGVPMVALGKNIIDDIITKKTGKLKTKQKPAAVKSPNE